MVLLAEIIEHEGSCKDDIDVLFIDGYVVQVDKYLHGQEANI
jgi:hypothetical protein